MYSSDWFVGWWNRFYSIGGFWCIVAVVAFWCNGPVMSRSLCFQADVDTSGRIADDNTNAFIMISIQSSTLHLHLHLHNKYSFNTTTLFLHFYKVVQGHLVTLEQCAGDSSCPINDHYNENECYLQKCVILSKNGSQTLF